MSRHTPKTTHGFTLIELLVVIAIIGLLSSVVLASLNTARTRANTAAVKAQVLELRKLMELEYSETGSYANLNRGWIGNGTSATTCEARGYAGSFATQAISICNRLRTIITNESYEFLTGPQGVADTYSIMATLPGGTNLFCVGSSGRTSTDIPNTTPGYSNPGCLNSP